MNEGFSPVGMFIVPEQYLCMGFVEGSGGTLKIWGYYPYEIISLKFSQSGKLKLQCKLINELGTTYQHNNFLESKDILSLDMSTHKEYFFTKEEAIKECHERNRGKKGSSPCHNFDMTKIADNEKKYIADKFY